MMEMMKIDFKNSFLKCIHFKIDLGRERLSDILFESRDDAYQKKVTNPIQSTSRYHHDLVSWPIQQH
jgi:hypothetical protein